MAQSLPQPNGSMLRLAGDVSSFGNLLKCGNCGKLPNPECYKICRKCGVILCELCSFSSPPRGNGRRQVRFEDEGSGGVGGDSSVNGSSCDHKGLQMGPPKLMEKLLEQTVWSCPNLGMGCTKEVLGTELAEHVGKCISFKCHVEECKGMIASTVNELNDHYAHHLGRRYFSEIEYLDVHLNVFNGNDSSGNPKRILKVLDIGFHLYLLALETRSPAVYIWLWDLGNVLNKNQVSKFRYQLAIDSPAQGNLGRITYADVCVPYERSGEEIISNGDCWVLQYPQLEKKYLSQEGLKMRVSIKEDK